MSILKKGHNMFSGIVAVKKPITSIEEKEGNLLIAIEQPADWTLEIGESVLVDGICSTVIEQGPVFVVNYMPETLAKTTIGSKKVGDALNLERSLRLSDVLSGHLVSGHIDTVGVLKNLITDDGAVVMEYSFPAEFGNYLVDKGSICINGVSLTVVKANPDSFTVALIPHTLEVTNLSDLKVGDKVNLEFDLLAKYVAKQLGKA
jgi:riboflavin synthase